MTGMPRSGTTWVGRMIDQVSFVRYIHEPFNISASPCHCGVRFDYWFFYLSSRNEKKYNEHLRHIIYPSYNWVGFVNMMGEISRKRRGRILINYLRAYLSQRPLVKDPLAVFSAGTLADHFNMDVVVTIRHPAAVVNSYKMLNWGHPFSHFLNQPELMEEHLLPFRSEIEDFVKKEKSIIEQVALLWKLIHHMIIKYREMYTQWIFAHYEDLALDPIGGYQKVFAELGLPFSEQTRMSILEHRLTEPGAEVTEPYAIKQNSEEVVSRWKRNLTASEVDQIRNRVEDVSSSFYSDDDWKL